ncbi:hypothetical protein DICPUDRAFT_79371 [Dictyostelium purpureum]|uniref:Calcineurin-like phosphoesterase domain-containing protein n=1 Tax=Dictyostelium purpureum TaxID=5786 RepID=F0ZMD8_DICPU|nr:uncharacterized protein DICPUDRAFT_79371 [Dictyostelium purpureum]EGC34882.1 hypothetical protein DICPUDRAFT_79371 [Dictyostelium purpureum]|eukprot:XP_003288574.1 hypothetical protein DICPUDRAFT_79371 [Dictyostelium purpureum]
MIVIGIVGFFSSFSGWGYLSYKVTILLSVFVLAGFTIFQLVNFYKEDIKKKVKERKYYLYSKSRVDPRISLMGRIKIQILNYFNDVISTIQFKPRLSFLLVGSSVLLGMFIPFALDNLCICSQPITVSTRLTRAFQESYCKDKEICFVYLTLPEDPSNSMILQVHTRNEPIETTVRLSKLDLPSSHPVEWKTNSFISVSEIIKEEPRFVSYIEFNSLSESTNYKFNFTITTKDGPIKSVNYGFKTFSSGVGDGGLKFIVGGDLNLNSDATDLARIGKDFNPDFVVIGGDIAYENGIGSCYRRWDEKINFLTQYFSYDQQYNSNNNNTNSNNNSFIKFLTPLLMSIGNHESGAFFQTHDQVPFYFKYFLFNIGDSKKPVKERLSYHIHKLPFGISLASLDSCVVSTWDQQTQWLDNQWSNEKYNNTSKLVVYHHPIYTSRRNINDKIPTMGQKSIVPLFDHYKVPFAFENHEHLFKRTKPLFNNKAININNNSSLNSKLGTVYVGDGSWGTSKYNRKPQEASENTLPWYLAKRSEINHLWFVTISNQEIIVEAFSPDNNKIDRVEYYR